MTTFDKMGMEVTVLNVSEVTYAVQTLLGVPYRRPIIYIQPKQDAPAVLRPNNELVPLSDMWKAICETVKPTEGDKRDGPTV